MLQNKILFEHGVVRMHCRWEKVEWVGRVVSEVDEGLFPNLRDLTLRKPKFNKFTMSDWCID